AWPGVAAPPAQPIKRKSPATVIGWAGPCAALAALGVAALTRWRSVLAEGFFAFFLDGRHHHDDQQQGGNRQQARRDRTRDEDRPVTARNQQRAAQVLLHHRAQDQAQQQGRRLAAELDEDVADE